MIRRQDEPQKVDSLIEKWTSVTREAVARLRDNIGPVVVTQPQIQRSFWGYGNEEQSDEGFGGSGSWGGEQAQPRLLTLKEVCERLKVDPDMLGQYDEDNDAFA